MCGPSCGHVQTVSVTCAVPLMDSFLLLSPPLFSSPYHTPDAVSTCWHTFLLFSTLFITPPSSSACKLTALPASFHSHTYLHRDSCFMSFVSLSITIATRRGPGLIPDAVIPLSHSSHACPGTPQPTPDFLIQDGIFWNNLATTSAATSPRPLLLNFASSCSATVASCTLDVTLGGFPSFLCVTRGLADPGHQLMAGLQ